MTPLQSAADLSARFADVARAAANVARASAALAAARLALRTLPWPRVLELIDASPPRPRRPPDAPRPADETAAAPAAAAAIATAVARASRVLPGTSSCLAQALAARALLHREGLPAEVRIGVSRLPPGGLDAHAWVESDGKVVLGAPDPKYAPFPGRVL